MVVKSREESLCRPRSNDAFGYCCVESCIVRCVAKVND